jgi:acyl carrier protein
MPTIEQDLREFVITNFLFGQDDGRLGPDTSFVESGVIDSTGMLELIGFLEQKFGLTVEDDELVPANLDSLQRLSSFVTRKLEARSASH